MCVCIYGTYVYVSVVKSLQTVRNALPKREFDIIPVIHRIKGYYNFMTNKSMFNSQKEASPNSNCIYIHALSSHIDQNCLYEHFYLSDL